MKSVAELREELKAAVEAEQVESRKRDEVRREAWDVLFAQSDSWEWRCIPTTYSKYMFKADSPSVNGIKVDRRLAPVAVEAFVARYGPVLDDRMTQWQGTTYIRTSENILTHCGGGWMVLNDPMLCNDQEWADLLAGRIAPKYKERGDRWF